MAAAEQDIQLVARTINLLYNSTETAQRENADEALRFWRKSPVAWEDARLLFSTEQTDEVYSFAAQTLRNKIMYDFVDLPSEAHQVLGTTMLSQISKYTHSYRTRRMLSIALCDFSLMTAATWQQPVESIIAKFQAEAIPPDPQQCPAGTRKIAGGVSQFWLPTLLNLLEYMPEENTNEKVMADRSTRRIHEASLVNARPQVFSLLNAISRDKELIPEVKRAALSCWRSWVAIRPFVLKDALDCTYFTDCFEILISAAGPSGLSPSSMQYTRACELTEEVTECVCAVLNRVPHNRYDRVCWERTTQGDQHANSSTDEDLSYVEAIVDQSLKYCGSEVFRQVVLSCSQDENVNLLCNLSQVIVHTGIAASGIFLCKLHEDVRLQTLLSTAMLLVDLATFELCGGEDGSGAEEGISGMYFWSKLAAKLGGLLHGQRSLMSHPESVSMLRRVFEKLLTVCIVRCVGDRLSVSSTGRVSSNFSRFRDQFVGGILYCATVEDPYTIVNIVLNRFSSLPTDPASQQSVKEAYFHILDVLIREIRENPQNVPVMFVLLENLPDILNTTAPEDSTEIATRIAAIRLASDATLWIQLRPALIPTLAKVLLTQAFLLKDQNSWRLSKMSFEAISSWKELCIEYGHTEEMQGMLEQFCELSQSEEASADDKLKTQLLQGISIVASNVGNNTVFLQVFEALCNPLMTSLKRERENSRSVCTSLEWLSTILKDIGPGVRQCDALGDLMATFVTNILWPVLEGILGQFHHEDSVTESCVRCLKHSLRCIGVRFKPLMPRVVEVMYKSARTDMHSSYLYCAEYLLGEFREDPECLPILDKFIKDLGEQALGILAERRLELDRCSELVEDCYGMFARCLTYIPQVAVSGPNIEKILRLCEDSVSLETRMASKAVFLFLRTALSVDNLEEPLQTEFSECLKRTLPEVIRSIFRVLVNAPYAATLDEIERVLQGSLHRFPALAKNWIEDGLAELPSSIKCSSEVKAETVDNICHGGRELEDLAYRCQQYMLRHQRF